MQLSTVIAPLNVVGSLRVRTRVNVRARVISFKRCIILGWPRKWKLLKTVQCILTFALMPTRVQWPKMWHSIQPGAAAAPCEVSGVLRAWTRKCNKCGYFFKFWDNLKLHVLNHSPQVLSEHISDIEAVVFSVPTHSLSQYFPSEFLVTSVDIF